jgi:hypothetical protein
LETENKNRTRDEVIPKVPAKRFSKNTEVTRELWRAKTSSFLFQIDVFACFLVKLVSTIIHAHNEKTNRGSFLRSSGFFDGG